jgi:hypothetical protein
MPEKDKMIIYITKQKETFPKLTIVEVRVRVRVFNGTFNNFSIISWGSVLLVEETGVPREK